MEHRIFSLMFIVLRMEYTIITTAAPGKPGHGRLDRPSRWGVGRRTAATKIPFHPKPVKPSPVENFPNISVPAYTHKPRTYLHFDPPPSARVAEALATDPTRVARHAFYPFLGFTIATPKMQKEKGATPKFVRKDKVLHGIVWVAPEGRRGARSSLPQKKRMRAR